MSETPRIDNATLSYRADVGVIIIKRDIARQVETDLARAQAELETVKGERDEATAFAVCAYCREKITKSAEAILEHMQVCKKNPLREAMEFVKMSKDMLAENERLVTDAEFLRAENQRLQKALFWLEGWFESNVDDGGRHACPWCYKSEDDKQWAEVKHTPDCVIGAALATPKNASEGKLQAPEPGVIESALAGKTTLPQPVPPEAGGTPETDAAAATLEELDSFPKREARVVFYSKAAELERQRNALQAQLTTAIREQHLWEDRANQFQDAGLENLSTLLQVENERDKAIAERDAAQGRVMAVRQLLSTERARAETAEARVRELEDQKRDLWVNQEHKIVALENSLSSVASANADLAKAKEETAAWQKAWREAKQ